MLDTKSWIFLVLLDPRPMLEFPGLYIVLYILLWKIENNYLPSNNCQLSLLVEILEYRRDVVKLSVFSTH
jgi:hypothetical protein